MEAQYFSTTATEKNRWGVHELQETGTDKSHFHSLTLLSPQIFHWAITKQTLIKLGFVAGMVQFIIKSPKASAGSQWTGDLATNVMTVETLLVV